MKKRKEKTSKFYLTLGLIISLSALFILIGLLIYSYFHPIEEIAKEYYLFILLGIGAIIFIIGYVLLRKSNRLKKEEIKKDDERVKKIIKEKLNLTDEEYKEYLNKNEDNKE